MPLAKPILKKTTKNAALKKDNLDEQSTHKNLPLNMTTKICRNL